MGEDWHKIDLDDIGGEVWTDAMEEAILTLADAKAFKKAVASAALAASVQQPAPTKPSEASGRCLVHLQLFGFGLE